MNFIRWYGCLFGVVPLMIFNESLGHLSFLKHLQFFRLVFAGSFDPIPLPGIMAVVCEFFQPHDANGVNLSAYNFT